MKIRIYSDLHLEFGRSGHFLTQRGDEDLVILAGDIHVGADGILWARTTFPDVPVIYVLGNHEFYQQDFNKLLEECRMAAAGSNVHVLERESFDFAGIRVLGTTLWTDFEALGSERVDEAMDWADKSMNDFWIIRENGKHLTPRRTAEAFAQNTAWLDQQIAASDRPVIAVTHHAPTLATLSSRYGGKISNGSFHSCADHLIRKPVRLWVHGHTHYNADVVVNDVRVVTNQGGYPGEGRGGRKLSGFKPRGRFELEI